MAQTSYPLKLVMPITHTFAVAALLSGFVLPLAQPAHGSVSLDCFLRQIERQPSPATEESTRLPRTEVPRAVSPPPPFERPPILNLHLARQVDRVQWVAEDRLAAFLRYRENNSPNQNREGRNSAPSRDSDVARARALLDNPERHNNPEFVRFLEYFQNELVVRSRNPETYPEVEELLAFYQAASPVFREHLAEALVDRTIRFRSSGYRGIDASGVTGQLTVGAVRGYDRFLDFVRRVRSLPPAERAQMLSRDPLIDGTEAYRESIWWGLDAIFRNPSDRSLNEGLRPVAFENPQQLGEYLLRLDRYLLQAQQQTPGRAYRLGRRVGGLVAGFRTNSVAQSFANAMMAPEINTNRELHRSAEDLARDTQIAAFRLGDIREVIYIDFQRNGIMATVSRRLSTLRYQVHRRLQPNFRGPDIVALAQSDEVGDAALIRAVADRTGVVVSESSIGAVRAALRDGTNTAGYVDAILAAEAHRLGLEVRAWLGPLPLLPEAVVRFGGVGVIAAHRPEVLGVSGLLAGALWHGVTSANTRARAARAEEVDVIRRTMTVERCYAFSIHCLFVAQNIHRAPALEARYPFWQRLCETGSIQSGHPRQSGHASTSASFQGHLSAVARRGETEPLNAGDLFELERNLNEIKSVGDNNTLAQACAQSVRYTPEHAQTRNARAIVNYINSEHFFSPSSNGGIRGDRCIVPSAADPTAENLFCVWEPHSPANNVVTTDYPPHLCGGNPPFIGVLGRRQALSCTCCVIGGLEPGEAPSNPPLQPNSDH